MRDFYGNIFINNIMNIVYSNNFQKYWYIKKDDIDGCKECEYRYICTDCRVFIKDTENIYSKPIKCPKN